MPVINGGLTLRVSGTTEKAVTIQRAGATYPVLEVTGNGTLLTGGGTTPPVPTGGTASPMALFAWRHFR